MISEWMKTDLIRQIDLEGLMLLKPVALDKIEETRKTIEESLALIENEIRYTRFVQAHLDEIKENHRIMFEIDQLAVELLHDRAGLNTEDPDINRSLDSYINYFDADTESVRNINIRCGDYSADLPDSPYLPLIADIRDQMKTCFSSSEIREMEAMTDIAAKDEQITKDIARLAGNLIKYDISNEYPDFCSRNIPAMELLLKDSSVTADSTVLELDELLEALADCKNQLECAESLITEK